MLSACAMCEYDRQLGNVVCSCPYAERYGPCCAGDEKLTIFERWGRAGTTRSRRKYARLGVEQLKALLGD